MYLICRCRLKQTPEAGTGGGSASTHSSSGTLWRGWDVRRPGWRLGLGVLGPGKRLRRGYHVSKRSRYCYMISTHSAERIVFDRGSMRSTRQYCRLEAYSQASSATSFAFRPRRLPGVLPRCPCRTLENFLPSCIKPNFELLYFRGLGLLSCVFSCHDRDANRVSSVPIFPMMGSLPRLLGCNRFLLPSERSRPP